MSAKVLPFPRRGEPSPAACAASLRRRAADVRVLAAQHIAAVSALEAEAETLERTAAMGLGEPYVAPRRTFGDPIAAMARAADPRAAIEGRIDWTSSGPLPEWLLEFPPSEDPSAQDAASPAPRALPVQPQGDQPREPA